MTQLRMNVQAPIERLFAERWSSRAFDSDKPVSRDSIASCLEAARWAPSCFGEEPWRYLVANRFENASDWQHTVDTLAAKNQLWAKHAPILIVVMAEPEFSHNGNPNRWAAYDTGQATICLCLQAASLGLASHQMGGFDPDGLKKALKLPDSLHVISVIALGYPGDVDMLEQDFQPMESASRTRKVLQENVHEGCWGTPWQPPASAGWEARYQETSMERLPWYHHGLDADFAAAISRLGMSGGAVLDIGCGPGTQAVALAKQGFSVTATDISKSAVSSAELLAEAEQVAITFQVDDILDSRLSGQFDLMLDRGIFHCFPDLADQQAYLATVKRLLKPQGLLLLKCFHKDETGEIGPPCRYDEADIRRLFGNRFELVEAHDSRFSTNTMEQPPKALFCVIRNNL